jgi:hypothetical protein
MAQVPLVCALAGNGTWQGTTPGLHALNAVCFTIPLLAPHALGGAIPSNDPYETNFTTGTPALPPACGGPNTGFYNCPYGLGNVNKTIGSARQFQFSLHLVF